MKCIAEPSWPYPGRSPAGAPSKRGHSQVTGTAPCTSRISRRRHRRGSRGTRRAAGAGWPRTPPHRPSAARWLLPCPSHPCSCRTGPSGGRRSSGTCPYGQRSCTVRSKTTTPPPPRQAQPSAGISAPMRGRPALPSSLRAHRWMHQDSRCRRDFLYSRSTFCWCVK